MNKEYFFNVADFQFSITSLDKIEIESLLPSFKDFFIDKQGDDDIFSVEVRSQEESLSEISSSFLMKEDSNDMGELKLYCIDSEYILDVRHTSRGAWHRMTASLDFKHIDVQLNLDDFYMGAVLCSMIRFAYSQAILYHQAISIHASSVIHDDNGYLFLGKSGMGKSTHARLWIEHIENTELLNDDNPTLVLKNNGTIWVYGTPWSGKTSCYRNIGAKVNGIVRLQQAKENKMTIVKDVDAFMALLPSCMVIRNNTIMCDYLYDTLEKIDCADIKIGLLHCLPNRAAAELCFKMINK